MSEFLRGLGRRLVLTPNTIRYRIEYRCLTNLLTGVPKPLALLIDLGAGSGEMSARLVEQGFAGAAIGLEPDPINFDLLQRRYAQLENSRCQNSSIESASIERESADLVLSTQVLEHIDNDDSAVARIWELTKPAGFALISVPHPPEIFPNPGHVRPGYTRESLKALFERHGFRLLRHEYFFVLATLRRMVAAAELGLVGKLLPIAWADRESNLSTAERANLQPYGIAALFQKPTVNGRE
ncbi:MAG TPA: class I SAM-dependent methyltransferase [Chthoniobacterales bacterium]|jgi:2-polyprenyl-3-methyl-5-hydroxy-6-metoxy-1,4-benzoquinol methylase|nr:class I SAM-dependent methyltransferase [Chthoniobacterales bacterium]